MLFRSARSPFDQARGRGGEGEGGEEVVDGAGGDGGNHWWGRKGCRRRGAGEEQDEVRRENADSLRWVLLGRSFGWNRDRLPSSAAFVGLLIAQENTLSPANKSKTSLKDQAQIVSQRAKRVHARKHVLPGQRAPAVLLCAIGSDSAR